jgi:hypothetical protein
MEKTNQTPQTRSADSDTENSARKIQKEKKAVTDEIDEKRDRRRHEERMSHESAKD